MPRKTLQVSSESGVSMPIKNLISIVGAVAIGVWSYFGIVERIGKLETQNQSLQFVLNSKIYRLLKRNNYNLINWVNSDLVFIHKNSKI